jgi:hypothetical protein
MAAMIAVRNTPSGMSNVAASHASATTVAHHCARFSARDALRHFTCQ